MTHFQILQLCLTVESIDWEWTCVSHSGKKGNANNLLLTVELPLFRAAPADVKCYIDETYERMFSSTLWAPQLVDRFSEGQENVSRSPTGNYDFVCSGILISTPIHLFGQFQTVSSSLIIAPREYQRQIELAERAIDSGQYTEAIQRLDAILSGPDGQNEDAPTEDFFVGENASTRLFDSLKSRAEKILANLPPRGRELYELQFGTEAKNILREGLVKRDVEKLTMVRRRYFATEAGQTATMLIGRHYLDSGSPLAASRCFGQLLDSRYAVEKFGEELYLLAAVSEWRAGNASAAERVLQRLKSDNPDAAFEIRGERYSLFSDNESPLAWLRKVSGVQQDQSPRLSRDWLTHRGSERRNAESSGSLPLMTNILWECDLIENLSDKQAVEKIKERGRATKTPVLPIAQPVVVNDMIMLRGAYGVTAII